MTREGLKLFFFSLETPTFSSLHCLKGLQARICLEWFDLNMCKESVASGLNSMFPVCWCWISALTHIDALKKKKHICALFQSWQSGHCPSFDAVLKILQACLNEDQTNGIFLQQDDSIRTLGADGHFLFSSLDTDHDLYLSPEEFKPIAEKLTGMPLLLLPVPTLRTSPT